LRPAVCCSTRCQPVFERISRFAADLDFACFTQAVRKLLCQPAWLRHRLAEFPRRKDIGQGSRDETKKIVCVAEPLALEHFCEPALNNPPALAPTIFRATVHAYFFFAGQHDFQLKVGMVEKLRKTDQLFDDVCDCTFFR